MDEQERLDKIKKRLAQIAVEVLRLTETIQELVEELETIQLSSANGK
jgi:hypothetical protein